MVEVAGLVSSLSLVFSELLIPLYGFYLVSGDKNYTQEKKKNHLDKISGPSGATGENIKPVPKTQKNKKNEAPIGDACSLTTSILVEDEDLVEDAGFDDGDTSISRARPGFGLRIFHVFMLIFGVFLFIFANIAGLERIRARYAADSRGRGTIEEIASFSH
ncbi:unnamed protein product [Amoebophrya sp. A25]|nr:unnamed protein product [Amoebophrya sp. A25]|eukprot:GSA25T00010019001.1